MKRLSWFLMILAAAMLVACSGPEARRDEYLKSAQELYDQGRFEEAKVHLKNARKVDNKYAPTFEMLGKVNYETKQWAGSLKNFTMALEIDPTLVDSMVGQGRVLLLMGRLDDAAESAEKALAIQPANGEAGLIKAATMARKDDRAGALELAEKIALTNPKMEEVYAFMSLIAFQEGQTDKSIAYLEDGLKELPTSVPLHKQLAGMFTRAERFDDAERIYANLLNQNPDDYDLQRMFMRFYFDAGQGEKARDMALKLAAANPDNQNYALILADVYSRLGQEEEQQKVLEDAKARYTPGYDPRLALIALYLRQGSLDQAAALARETAEIEPANEKAITARRALVDVLVRQVKYDEAEAELDKIFTYSPQDMEAQIFKGRVLLARGEAGEAIALFRRALDMQPDLLPVYGFLSQAHYIHGEVELAKDTLVKALRVKPEFAQARTALINLYLADDEYGRAINLLRETARMDPENLAPIASMGDVYVMQGKYDEAAQRYRSLMKQERGMALGLYKLGQMEAQRKNYDLALDYFNKLLEGAPQAFQAAESIVGVYLLQEKYANATAFCDKLLENGPNPGAYDLKGRIEAAQGNLAKAEEYFFKAKEIEPRWRDPYQMVGAMYLRAGKTQVAVEKFQRALDENPDVIGNAYILGMLYQEQGDNKKAAEMYEYVLERDRTFLPAVNNLAYLYADTSTDPDQLNRALELALRAAGRASSATLDTLGWVYFKTGNNNMALSTLLRAMEMDNNDPVIILHLAKVHAAMGAPDQARPLAEKVAGWEGDIPEKAEAAELLNTL